MKNSTTFLIACLLLFIACEDQNQVQPDNHTLKSDTLTVTINGNVEKGPYLNGSSITISELKSDLSQTGRVFTSQIVDNEGTFSVNNIELLSPYVELVANGFYFNEITNETSEAQLTLYALSSIQDTGKVNVNILSTLTKPRITYLISEGLSFNEAKIQAESEVKAIFDPKDVLNNDNGFEQLSILESGSNNALLLSASAILQANRSVGELSELISNIGKDIKEDGILDSEEILTSLYNHSQYIDAEMVVSNLTNKFATKAENISSDIFNQVLSNFVSDTFNVETLIEFPTVFQNDSNLLTEDVKYITPDQDYCLAANLPENVNFIVKLSNSKWYTIYASNENMNIETYNEFDRTQIFTSVESGKMSFVKIGFQENANPVTIEVFENDNAAPIITRVLEVKTQEPEVVDLNDLIEFPQTGVYGQNVLAKDDLNMDMTGYGGDSIYISGNDTYSVAANILNSDYRLKIVYESGYGGEVVVDSSSIIGYDRKLQTENGFYMTNLNNASSVDQSLQLLDTGSMTLKVQLFDKNSNKVMDRYCFIYWQ